MGVYLGKIPVGIIVGTRKGFPLYCNIEQIINGNLCELIITDGDENSEYILSFLEDREYLAIYLNEK